MYVCVYWCVCVLVCISVNLHKKKGAEGETREITNNGVNRCSFVQDHKKTLPIDKCLGRIAAPRTNAHSNRQLG